MFSTIIIFIFSITIPILCIRVTASQNVKTVKIPQRISKVKSFLKYAEDRNEQIANRRKALASAELFIELDSTNNIWYNMSLSNAYCDIKLSNHGENITVTEKSANNWHYSLEYTARYPGTHPKEQQIWNYLCLVFDEKSNYNSIKKIFESITSIGIQERLISSDKHNNMLKLTDINNCSEEELVDLPFINTILAKKIIKLREELNGFKNMKDFFKYINLSTHAKKQLIYRICFEIRKEAPYQQHYDERNLDF